MHFRRKPQTVSDEPPIFSVQIRLHYYKHFMHWIYKMFLFFFLFFEMTLLVSFVGFPSSRVKILIQKQKSRIRQSWRYFSEVASINIKNSTVGIMIVKLLTVFMFTRSTDIGNFHSHQLKTTWKRIPTANIMSTMNRPTLADKNRQIFCNFRPKFSEFVDCVNTIPSPICMETVSKIQFFWFHFYRYFCLVFCFCRSLSYNGASNFNALLTPITFLVSYFNSAINPLLYAFLSRNFRKGMREIILCSLKKDNTKSLQQRIPLHVSKSLFWHIIDCDIFTRFFKN